MRRSVGIKSIRQIWMAEREGKWEMLQKKEEKCAPSGVLEPWLTSTSSLFHTKHKIMNLKLQLEISQELM